MPRIAIFASGSGSNAREIIKHFKDHDNITVALIVSNRKKAGVFDHAFQNDIPSRYIPKSDFKDKNLVLNILEENKIEWIVLAGFLLLIPSFLVKAFPKRIINIHPSLLPKYGGKGMYGRHVHEAVKNNQEKTTGLTIHYVNEQFDEGEFIQQFSLSIDPDWEADKIAEEVLKLEHQHFAPTIEEVILEN